MLASKVQPGQEPCLHRHTGLEQVQIHIYSNQIRPAAGNVRCFSSYKSLSSKVWPSAAALTNAAPFPCRTHVWFGSLLGRRWGPPSQHDAQTSAAQGPS